MRLLLSLATDIGARRGELAALQLDDLRGHDLRIVRAVLAEQVSITKTGRTRRVTLGATTALLWRDTVSAWQYRPTTTPLGPWLFTPHVPRRTRPADDCPLPRLRRRGLRFGVRT